jgi:transcriptional regulator with XRE-family HTH domain
MVVNGHAIKNLREDRNLTTEMLADEVHVSQPTISRIEIGVKKPSVELLKRIADFFGVTVDELLI